VRERRERERSDRAKEVFTKTITRIMTIIPTIETTTMMIIVVSFVSELCKAAVLGCNEVDVESVEISKFEIQGSVVGIEVFREICNFEIVE
jgi:hypothetical protein